MDLSYNSIGKIDLNEIYNRGDPSQYFAILGALDYCIPQKAKPIIQDMIQARRTSTGKTEVNIVDIGCSYGVNAAMLKYDLTFDELQRHYMTIADRPRSSMLEEDTRFFGDPVDSDLNVVGVETAHRALRYALESGVVDSGTTANFEEDENLSQAHKRLFSDADIVMSTGCYGYVTSRTLNRILDCCQDNGPWMLHTVLRMFDFSEAIDELADRNYVTQVIGEPVRQRRFASALEQDSALERLADRSVDVSGREANGWYYADIFLSQPISDARQLSAKRGAKTLN